MNDVEKASRSLELARGTVKRCMPEDGIGFLTIPIKDMSQENIFKNYVLAEYTVKRLDAIREQVKEDILGADPLWQIIARKRNAEEHANVEDTETSSDSADDRTEAEFDTPQQFSSTQFYFTQIEKPSSKNVKRDLVSKSDIVEYLFEALECSNGKLDPSQLENLEEAELVEMICHLEKKLTTLGTYNLCCSINKMNLEHRIKYGPVFHSCLLLPKIVALEEPSRLLVSVLVESVQKFPDDIQKLIFIPLLNIDLKDTTIVDAIVNAFEAQRRGVLVAEYLSNAKELKSWHISFLQTLIPVKTDASTNDKLLQLLSDKATDFAKDKHFGKLVLSFVKANAKLSKEQQRLLWEIANANETIFKRPIQNVLRAM